MSLCPECGEEIAWLKVYEKGYETSSFDGSDYSDYEFEPSGEGIEYSCPECSETLFTDTDRAILFLRGEHARSELTNSKIDIEKKIGEDEGRKE